MAKKSFNASDSKTGRAAKIALESSKVDTARGQVWQGGTKFKNSAPPGESAVARKQRRARQG
jgi:hypothetical protein